MAAAVVRPIQRSVGSRVRVVFGQDSSEWLLLLDADDGSREWQVHKWGAIPEGMARQLNNCTSKGRYVTHADFGGNGAWFISGIKRDGSGGHSWSSGSEHRDELRTAISRRGLDKVSFGSGSWRTCGGGNESCAILSGSNGYALHGAIRSDTDLITRMASIRRQSKGIKFLRLFSDSDYFLQDDVGSQWKCGAGPHFDKELRRENAGVIEDVAVSGDKAWVIVRASGMTCSFCVPVELRDHLNAFFRDQGSRNKNHQIRIRSLRELAAQLERLVEAQRAEEIEQAAERERERSLARERAQASLVSAITSAIEDQLVEDAKYIKKTESELINRKQAFDSICQLLSPAQRARFEKLALPDGVAMNEEATSDIVVSECVVCQDGPAQQAIIPCGHHCLCSGCASILTASSGESVCPLCRARVQSTLTIYGASSSS